jgi:hypothetical protein
MGAPLYLWPQSGLTTNHISRKTVPAAAAIAVAKNTSPQMAN